MPGFTSKKFLVSIFILLALLNARITGGQGYRKGHQQALGPLFESSQTETPTIQVAPGLDTLHRWNSIAIDASGVDHTPVQPGENRVFGEQLGPTRASRAMAIVHIAMFDAMNAIEGGYKSYTGIAKANGNTSTDAAVAQAAHDTLVAMFPSQAATFDNFLSDDLAQIQKGQAKTRGINLGHQVATAILNLRSSDGSQQAEPRVGIEFITSDDPGKWRQDPISQIPIALGAYWEIGRASCRERV